MVHTFSGSTSERKVRMMVLETDEPHPDDHDEHGSFGHTLDHLFKTAGDRHDPPLGIETAMKFVVEPKGGVMPTIRDMDGVHAVLITGSMYDAHGNDVWIVKLLNFLKDLWRERPDMRFSGVCFGHQILCRMLGSKVEPTSGEEWELAHSQVTLNKVGEALFQTTNKIHLHQMHQDHVVYAPSATTSDFIGSDDVVHVWGSSDHTEVQGVYLRERLFTSQGHLGFNEKMVKRQIDMRVDSGGVKDSKQAEMAKETADLEHDGEIVASAILRFFHGEDKDIY